MEDIKSKSGKAFPLQKLSSYYSTPIHLEKDDRISGAYAWLALATAVIAYDTYAITSKKAETLTRYFWRSTEEPKKSIIPLTCWAILTAHLLVEKNIRRKKFGEQKQ